MPSVTLPENCVIFYTSSPIDNGIETKIPVSLTQFDTHLAVVAFTILEHNKVYIPPSGADINVRWEKADGNGVYNPVIGVDDNGVVYFEVTTQMTAAEGMGSCCIEIGYDGGQKNTKKVPVYVSKNPVNNENIESTYEYKTLQTIFQEIKLIEKNVQEGAENAAQSEQNAAQSEQNAAQSEQNALDYKNQIKGDADIVRGYRDEVEADRQEVIQNVAETEDNVTLSKSWAVGGTGTREGEDTNNAKYWAQQTAALVSGYLGYYPTSSDLLQAHPTGNPGEYAIVGETNTIWVYSVSDSTFVNTGNLDSYYTKTEADDLFATKSDVVHVFTVTVDNSSWTDNSGTYYRAFTCSGVTTSSKIIGMNFSRSNGDSFSQTYIDSFSQLFQYAETGTNTITLYAASIPNTSMVVDFAVLP